MYVHKLNISQIKCFPMFLIYFLFITQKMQISLQIQWIANRMNNALHFIGILHTYMHMHTYICTRKSA